MLYHVSGFPYFLRLNVSPLYMDTTFPLSVHPLVGFWVASTSGLLRIILQWTQVYKYIFEILLSIVLDFCPNIGLMGYMVILFSIF